MQFQVPQFIDVQPKIIGPLTIRQFLFLVAGIAPSFILFFFLKLWLWIFIAGIFMAIATAFAFVKINGQPLTKMGLAAFHYFWEPRFYLWRRADTRPTLPKLPSVPFPKEPKRTPIRELAFKVVTTTRPIEKRERADGFFAPVREKQDRFESFRKTTGDRAVARRVDYR